MPLQSDFKNDSVAMCHIDIYSLFISNLESTETPHRNTGSCHLFYKLWWMNNDFRVSLFLHIVWKFCIFCYVFVLDWRNNSLHPSIHSSSSTAMQAVLWYLAKIASNALLRPLLLEVTSAGGSTTQQLNSDAHKRYPVQCYCCFAPLERCIGYSCSPNNHPWMLILELTFKS